MSDRAAKTAAQLIAGALLALTGAAFNHPCVLAFGVLIVLFSL